MLDRKTLVEGDHVVVKDIIKDGLGGTSQQLLVRESLLLSAMHLGVNPGGVLEVVEPYHKEGSIAVVTVRHLATGFVGKVYWCSLRLSCDRRS